MLRARANVEIGIIGTGAMGCALARCFAEAGHRVFLGSRDEARGRSVAAGLSQTLRGEVSGGSMLQAFAFGPGVVLAVPWTAVTAALTVGGSELSGKVLIDCTNPMVGARRPLVVGRTTSGAEQIAEDASGAYVVKAFNAIAARIIASGDPMFCGHAAAIFHCGDNAQAKSMTAGLIADIGYQPFDVGPLSAARYLEPLAALCLRLEAAVGHGRDVILEPLARQRKKTSNGIR